MAQVFFCSHTNSTLFTTCCSVAITDGESCCPHCGEEVSYSPRERWNMAMDKLYGREKVQKMRDEWARKDREEAQR